MIILSLYAFMNTELCSVYYYFGIDVSWYHALLTIFMVTFLTWEGNRLIKPLIRKRFLQNGHNQRFLGVFFLAGNIVSVLAAVIAVFVVGVLVYAYNWEQNTNPLKLNIIYATLINLFLHLLNTILFYFREYRQKWIEAEDLRHSTEQARMQLIRSQVNPHFLFNNLNVLSGMLIRDNPEANRFIEEFSKVYRYILSNQQKEIVELKDELEFVRPYLFLLHKRFNEGLDVQIRIDDEYLNWQVVPAALQMLIENAIKHNVVSRHKPLVIDIHTNGNHDLVVRNNLQLRTEREPSTNTGILNIRRRYELISGKDVMVKQSGDFFEVTLPLLQLNRDHESTDSGRRKAGY